MKWLFFSAVICPLFFALPAEAVATNTLLDGCFIQAGKRYQIAPDLLKTIAQQESSLVATAIHHNKNKSGKIISTDYGIMQINSVHIPELKKLGVIKDKNDLLNNPVRMERNNSPVASTPYAPLRLTLTMARRQHTYTTGLGGRVSCTADR